MIELKINSYKWIYWIILIFFILIILSIFFKDEKYEFIGLKPLMTNNHSIRKYLDNDDINKFIEDNEYNNENSNSKSNSKHNNKKPYEKESKGEKLSRDIFQKIFSKDFVKIRPDFLKNPKTGRNLELDGYCPELNIAFEYNGIQHYVFPNFCHKTEKEFLNQVENDSWKKDACDKAGVYLISIPYNIPTHEIEDYIIERLP
uniref:Restriction endonuclease n=1 Tax=Pithovirus LCPAC104 TaxID=2506589 RepID=A0A481Z4V1_9VIRU|nr:MAG: restriction endonuclease [Pithovirus LCPAC104]